MFLQRIKVTFLTFLLALALFFMLRTALMDLAGNPEASAGTVLIWHGWGEEEDAVLRQVVAKYTELHPEIQVVTTAMAQDELLIRFQEASQIGFGPDLFIGPAEWVRPLADAGMLVPLEDRLEETTLERYLPTALTSLRYQDHLYGMPLAVHTLGLYANEDLVAPVATDLEQLLAQARGGVQIGLNPSFETAFWGISAFGGRLFDEQGRVILDQGGFANWLNWLKNAQEIPSFVLSTDQAALRRLFVQGELGYLVDSSQAWQSLSAGEDAPQRVTVHPLPAGPTGPPGPFLRVEALFFSGASSPHQTAVALDLARFLTNVEQQTTFMRQIQRIPANSRISINARLNPAVAAFASQARSALAFPLDPAMDTVVRLGDDTYTRVLEGLLTPAEAATQIAETINRQLGFEMAEEDGTTCASVGSFSLWHTWSGPQEASLEALLSSFRIACPNINVRSRSVAPTEFVQRLRGATTNGSEPELLMIPHTLLRPLATDPGLRSLGALVDPELLQRYRPLALDAFRLEDRLVGIPLSLATQALVYDRSQVQVPAVSLDELLLHGERGQAAGLDLYFADLYWGVGAFRSEPVDGSELILEEASFSQWLAWLHQAEATGGLVLDEDGERLDQLLLDGSLAYRVVTPEKARTLAQQLDGEQLGVTVLPGGPGGAGTPLAVVDGFVIPSQDRDPAPLLEFIQFATRADTQRMLVEATPLVPANANVDLSGDPLLAPYVQQLATTLVYPTTDQMATIAEFGGDAYIWTLGDVLPPQEAAAEALSLIQQVVGTETDSPSADFACQGSGRVRLWHATSGVISQTLQSLADAFESSCPDIQMELTRYSGDRYPLAAEVSSQEAPGVDLVLGPNAWTADLVDSTAIVSLDAAIDPGLLRRLLAPALDSVRVGEMVYALPLSVQTQALYVNQDRVATPATSLDELLNEGQIGRRLALPTGAGETFWGVGAYAGPPGQVQDDQSNAPESRWPSLEALTGWMDWLRRASQTPGVILGDEDGRARALFANGRLAYYVGTSQHLTALRTALGSDRLGVVRLPAGPGGPATPLLQSQVLYLPATTFSAEMPQTGRQAAATAATYLAGVDAQTLLMAQAGLVPANRLVDTASFPAIAGFVAQSENAMATAPGGTGFLQAMDAVVTPLLTGDLSPRTAAERILAASSPAAEGAP